MRLTLLCLFASALVAFAGPPPPPAVWPPMPPVITNVEDEVTPSGEPVSEEVRQASKPLELRHVENNFLLFCDQLTGSTSHAKLGFDELNAILTGMADQQVAVYLAVQMLAIDAEAKREGGLRWWDDCAWHPELVVLSRPLFAPRKK